MSTCLVKQNFLSSWGEGNSHDDLESSNHMQHAQSRWSPALQPHGTCRMVTARLQTAACTCCRGNPPRATVKTTAIPLSHYVLDCLTCVGFVKTACRKSSQHPPMPVVRRTLPGGRDKATKLQINCIFLGSGEGARGCADPRERR